MGTKLFVGNLSFTTTEAGLREIFERGGHQVADVRIVTDRDTGRSRGFGFVEMASQEGAQAAMTAVDGQELDGRALRVNEANDRPERRDSPRGAGGGGGRGRGRF